MAISTRIQSSGIVSHFESYVSGEIFAPDTTDKIIDYSVHGGSGVAAGIPGTGQFVRDVILDFPKNTRTLFNLLTHW